MPLMGGGVKPMVTASGCIMVTPSTLVLMAEALLSDPATVTLTHLKKRQVA